MKESIGKNDQLKIAKQKLYNLGYIQSHGGIQNNPERMKRLKNQLELSVSIAEINASKEKDKKEKLNDLKMEYRNLAKSAIQNYLSRHEDAKKITKKEIAAVIYPFSQAPQSVTIIYP